MPTLAEEAAAAWQAELDAAEAARDAERKALRAAATDALRSVLVTRAGVQLRLVDLGLTASHVDLKAGLVVWSDTAGTALAARRVEQAWHIFVVRRDAGQWVQLGERVTTLTQVGARLAAFPEPKPAPAPEPTPAPEPAPATTSTETAG